MSPVPVHVVPENAVPPTVPANVAASEPRVSCVTEFRSSTTSTAVVVPRSGAVTRVAVNVVMPPTGRSLIGALDAGAVGKVKRWMASARRVEGGGTLTVIASLATDSGARIDEVLGDELHETCAVELVLDRATASELGHAVVDPSRSFVRHAAALLGEHAAAWRGLLAAAPSVQRVLATLPIASDRAALIASLAPET